LEVTGSGNEHLGAAVGLVSAVVVVLAVVAGVTIATVWRELKD
jgi:hypothetical protein